MERREFLKRTGPAVALAAVTGTTGFVFHNRETTRRRLVLAKAGSWEVPPDSSLPTLATATNSDPASALNAAMNGIGGITRFVRAGERVLLKPNVGWDRNPAQGANTNPALVSEMVRLCLSAGASQVIVTDVSCNDPRRSFLRSGIKEAGEVAGASVMLPTPEDFVDVDLGGTVLTRWPVLKHFVQADRLINMPNVKQHSLTRCTIGMKNLYGILGGRRNRLHQEIDIIHTLTGVSQTDIGSQVYASDDATLTLTATSNTRIGRIVAIEGTNLMRVRCQPLAST